MITPKKHPKTDIDGHFINNSVPPSQNKRYAAPCAGWCVHRHNPTTGQTAFTMIQRDETLYQDLEASEDLCRGLFDPVGNINDCFRFVRKIDGLMSHTAKIDRFKVNFAQG